MVGVELYDRFHAMKTYGKEPESLSSIVRVFVSDLAGHSAEQIIRAIRTHAQRCDEFPTTADIAGLIRRNGRARVTEAQFVAINRKAGSDRTEADWQALRDWEAEQRGWDDRATDVATQDGYRAENGRLRKEVAHLRKELSRVEALLRAERERVTASPSSDDRVASTVKWMEKSGAKQIDIEEFIASQQGSAAAPVGVGSARTIAQISPHHSARPPVDGIPAYAHTRPAESPGRSAT